MTITNWRWNIKFQCLLRNLPTIQANVYLDPKRFTSSKAVGAHFGLTPKKYRSGETDITGRISKIGDGSVRTALLNWSLDGLRRLTKNKNRFTRVKSTEDAILTMQDIASPVAAFVRQRRSLHKDKEIPVDLLFQTYKLWCTDNNEKVPTNRAFGSDLAAAFPSIQRRRPTQDAGRIYVYSEIDLRSAEEAEEDERRA